MWGVGTALGELPPYFIARAGLSVSIASLSNTFELFVARLTGQTPDDSEYEEFLHMTQQGDDVNQDGDEKTSLLVSVKRKCEHAVEKIVEKTGFLGILLCASIPNPLFDLAGITCGHFLVPFCTFFFATLLGKALIKTHLQVVESCD